MFEKNDLARAMSELPDDLLLEAEQTAKPRKTIKFRRLIAAAAVIALLGVTVCAASMGITWNVEKETHKSTGFSLDYYKDSDGTLDFDKLEYTVPLGVTKLPDWNMMQIRDRLRFHWDLTQLEEYAQYNTTPPGEQILLRLL